MPEYFVIEVADCPRCYGTGVVGHPAWEQYWAEFGDAGRRNGRDFDGNWFSYAGYDEIPPEEIDCGECEGKGKTTRQVNLIDALNEMQVKFQEMVFAALEGHW